MSDTQLTKRERAAIEIMARLVAAPDTSGTFEAYARDAVRYADALLRELERIPPGEENDRG
jgi:hypothetical protein